MENIFFFQALHRAAYITPFNMHLEMFHMSIKRDRKRKRKKMKKNNVAQINTHRETCRFFCRYKNEYHCIHVYRIKMNTITYFISRHTSFLWLFCIYSHINTWRERETIILISISTYTMRHVSSISTRQKKEWSFDCDRCRIFENEKKGGEKKTTRG